ncbi:MAG: PhoPQ-activated protein PqaA family protein, partial [Armatimonadota bacterium]
TMDAIEQYPQGAWETPVSGFITTGGSKRGWTTWFTGAVVPERLKGIVPMVYDNLNLAAQMPHQVATWGDYSAMIHDYTERGLPDLLATEEGRELGAMVDPYTLRERITMPKLILTGTNDPYWPLDAANLYWDDLTGPKYILYVPNAGHGLDDFTRVISAQVGFFLCCTGRAPFPEPSWRFEEEDELRLIVEPGGPVKRVTQWTAHTPTRDFRASTWTEAPAIEQDGAWLARAAYPEAGHAALFAEIVYEVDGREFPLSTNVRIVGPR